MSKENALVELWRIVNNKQKVKDKTMFEWRHHHLRAVWLDKVAVSPPENIIFVYSQDAKGATPKMDVAYALVDVIKETATLRVHALMTRPPGGGVWKFNSAKMIALKDKSFRLALVDIPLPTEFVEMSQDGESTISEVHQRDETGNYTNFMKKVWEAWENETVSFFTKKNHKILTRQAVTVYAENLSMGIKLKGLGFIRSPGPSTILKTPVASAETLAVEEINFSGIHYAGLGVADATKVKDPIPPLGMMFLDTLFLDSFSLTDHKLNKKSQPLSGKWPVDGALVEFFKHPSDVKSYIHVEGKPNQEKGRQEKTASDITSYSLTEEGGLVMKIKSIEYSPLNSISFIFGADDDDDLERADDGNVLMETLTEDFSSIKIIKKSLNIMVRNLFPADREAVALRIFGDKAFAEILGKEEKDDAEAKEKLKKEKAAALAKKEATEKLNTEKALAEKKKKEQTLATFLEAIINLNKDIENHRTTLSTATGKAAATVADEKRSDALATVFNTFAKATKDLAERFKDLQKQSKEMSQFLKKDHTNVTAAIQGVFQEWVLYKAEVTVKSKPYVEADIDRMTRQENDMETALKTMKVDEFKKTAKKVQEGLKGLKRLMFVARVYLTTWITAFDNSVNTLETRLTDLLGKMKTAGEEDTDFVDASGKMVTTIAAANTTFLLAANAALLVDPEQMTPGLTEAMKVLNISIVAFKKEYDDLSINVGTQTDVVVAREKMVETWATLRTAIQTQAKIFLDQDIARMTLQETDMQTALTKSIKENRVQDMQIFNETVEKIQKGIKSMNLLIVSTGIYYKKKGEKAYKPQQKNLLSQLTKLQTDSLNKLRKDKVSFEEAITNEVNNPTLINAASLPGWRISLAKLKKQIKELQDKLGPKTKKKIVKKKIGKTRREIIYGSAKPAAATLYRLGSRGRIDAQRIREDPIYTGSMEAEVTNLSNFKLEFYGSSGAAIASRLSLGSSIQAEDLIPKAVTADGGRLEQTAFDYYYGAYWVDEYTGFETSGNGGGKVTSFPANYVTIPGRGAILYHIGSSKVGSISYDFANMAQQVSLDNPDFEIMLRSPAAGEDVEASPGSSRLSTSGAIILGLRLPEGGSGSYSVRSIVYAPRLIKM